MSHQVRRLAYLIKNDVEGVEVGVDTQIAQTARFLATLCEARVAANAPADTGHQAMLCAGEVLNLQLASRDKLVELHGRLGEVAGKVGFQELAGAGSLKPGPGSALTTGSAPGGFSLVADDSTEIRSS